MFMQLKQKLIAACLSVLALTLSLGSARATTITNADTSATLNLGTAWVGGVVPASAIVAVWDSTVQVNLSKTLGASASWAGIQELNPGGLVTIGADGNTLTLGASGIDLSLGTNSLNLGCGVVLGANQTWDITNGQTLTVSGVLGVSTATVLYQTGGGTLNFNGTANGTYTGNLSLNGGVLIPAGANGNNNSAVGTGIITNNSGSILRSANKIVGNVLVFNGTNTVDANLENFTLDGSWQGSGTVIITNLASGMTLTSGGNGNGGGTMANFTGNVIVATTNSDGVTLSAGTFRFNNGGGNNNLGNAAMTLDLGNGSAQFSEKNASQTTTFGALFGGPNTVLAKAENYVIGALGIPDTFAGNIESTSTLTKSGTGTLTLTGNNTYTGTTTINTGLLQIGDGVTTGAGALGTGAVTINAAGTLLYNKPDAFTVANNISGAGTLIQTNVSTFTYSGNDTASGTFTVSAGTLALGAAGLISAPVYLASGTIYNITGNSAYTLGSSLSGSGTVVGLLTAASGTLNPGGTGAAGTLTFSNGLTEQGNINNQFELTSPTGANDLLNVVGDLTLAGTNNIILGHLGGGTIPNGTYPLITYSGNFNGTLSQFAVTVAGVKGVLTNLPNEIAIVISPNIRGSTNLTWVGDGVANNWDTTSSNWVNGVTSFNFLAGDSVIFNNTGLANPTVTLATLVSPAAVLVNSTGNYSFTGNYGIADSATPTSLVKTNSGILAISSTNSYTGPTIIGGGSLQIFNVANGVSPSAIGAANSNPTNLVFYGSTLAYAGPSAATDRGATLSGAGATIDVIAGTDLTLNGLLTGPGGLTEVDGGTLTLDNVNSYAGETVLAGGLLALGSNNANNNGAGSSAFGSTNNPVVFNGGTLQLYGVGQGTANNYNTFFNPLVVPAGQTGTLLMFPRGPINTGGGAGINCNLSGSGTLNLAVNYVRDAISGNWSAFSGLLVVNSMNGSGDEFRINNNYGYANATIFLNGSLTMDSTLTAGATINIGALGGLSTATLGAGNESAPGPTWSVGWNNTTNTFAGTIADDNTAPGGHTSVTKVGTAVWYVSGQNTYTGNTSISNGVLALVNNPGTGLDGSFAASTNIFINTGAALDLSGTLDDNDTFYLASGQVLGGYGTLRGSLDTTQGGTVTGGGGIAGGVGILTVTNSINLGGVAWMKLNRASTPNSDRLVSSTAGIINYGGTLVLTNIGPRLQVGDTFTLFSAAQLNNSFTLQLPNYYAWNTTQLGVNGQVSVSGVSPVPAITSVDYSQLANSTLTFNSAGGVPSGSAVILTTTNLTLPLGQWSQAGTGNFDGNGNLSLPVTVNPALPQQFFILESY